LLPSGPKPDPFVLFLPDPKSVLFDLLPYDGEKGIVLFLPRLEFWLLDIILENTVKGVNVFVLLFLKDINERLYTVVGIEKKTGNDR